MYKFRKHRREIIKDFSIRGYEKSSSVDGDSLLLPCSSGILRKLSLWGKTEQKQYEGYNLFNEKEAELKDCTYENGIYTAVNSNCCVDIKLPAGKYTISFVKSSDFSVYLRNGRVASGYISMIGATANTATFNFAADNDGYLRISWFDSNKTLSKIQIVQGSDIKPYEPYVGGIPSPNPTYPQRIVNGGNSGLDIVVKGANLFNIDDVKGCTNNINTPNDVGAYAYGTKEGDELVARMGSYGTGTFFTNAKIPIKQAGTYSVALQYFVDEKEVTSLISVGLVNINLNKSLRATESGKAKGQWHSSLFNLEIPEEWIGSDVYFSAQGTGGDGAYTNMNVRFKNITITYGESGENEPYIEPQSITIDDVTLCGIDVYSDVFKIDFSKNTAYLFKKILYVNVADLIDGFCSIVESDGHYCAEIINLPQWKGGTKAYCTHCKQYDYNDYSANEVCFELTEDGYQSKLYFYNIEATTNEEFTAWCYENEVQIAYILENEEEHITPYNLPREVLPYGVSAVIEAEGCAEMSAVYYSLNE